MFIAYTHLNIQLYVPFKDFSLIDIWTNRQTYLALETPCRSLTIRKYFLTDQGLNLCQLTKPESNSRQIRFFSHPSINILELAQVQNQCPKNNTHLIKLYFRGSFWKTWLSLIIRRFRIYVKTDLESNLVWVNIRKGSSSCLNQVSFLWFVEAQVG